MRPVLFVSLVTNLFVSAVSAQSPEAARPSRVTLGVGVVSLAAYPGSDDRRVLPVPILAVDLGRVYIGGGAGGASGGAGIYLVRSRTVTWSAEIGGTINRPADLSNDLAGFADRGFGTTAGSTLSVRLGPAQLSSTVATGLRRAVGTSATASLGVQQPIGGRVLLAFGVSGLYANQQNMAWDFGISATDAANSGRPSYSPRAGLKEINATFAPVVRVASGVSLFGFGKFGRLANRAAASPLVRQRNVIEGGAALAVAL